MPGGECQIEVKNCKMNNWYGVLILAAIAVLIALGSCKKDDSNYYETGIPAFAVYQKDGEPEAFYGYCASHDIYLDSVFVTSPINIRSKLYYQGVLHMREVHFLIGNSFIPGEGIWAFTFYGRRTVNNTPFQSFYQNIFK